MTPDREHSRPPVVVVGAGPAGLVATTVLARHGHDVLLLERRASGSEQPRATVLSLRTMELMRTWGLEQEIRAGGDDVVMALLEMPSAAQAGSGTVHDVGYTSPAQSAVVSPTAPACVAQDHFEAVLLAHLSDFPNVVIRRGVQALAVSEEDGATEVRLRDEASGAEEWCQASFVVAADGARSAIRSALGIAMEGPDDVMRGVSVEFRAPLWEVLGPHRYGVYTVSDPDAPAVLLPAGQGDRWLLGIDADTLPDVPGPYATAEVERWVRSAAGVPDLPVRIERVGRYSSGAQLAERFSAGSTFLVGDAAHRVTPRGGTGLNTAIGDGLDLGWKLAWVLRGWAPRRLLGTYESERRGPARHNLERSMDPMGSRRPAVAEMQYDLGGRVTHAWVEGGDGLTTTTSTLDLVGPGLTLYLAGIESAVPTPPYAGLPPLTHVPLPLGTARALGLSRPGAALLVRPDGVPVGQWAVSPTRTQVHAAVDAWLRGPQQPDAREMTTSEAPTLRSAG